MPRQDLGIRALRIIAEVWQVDSHRAIWSDEGFDWWPGDFRVKVRVSTADTRPAPETWRISVQTELLKNVVRSNELATLVADLSLGAHSTFAWTYLPASENHKEERAEAAVWAAATAYINEETLNSYSRFFAGMAILQPIEAQMRADQIAGLLGGQPNRSRPEAAGENTDIDEVLWIADEVYAPAGKEPSRWVGTEEFGQIAETYGRSDSGFGIGDSQGLTLETPFGQDSALIRLHTDQAHPQFGNGLLSTLQLPAFADEGLAEDCAWLNFFEYSSWTGFPLLGSWIKRPSEGLSFASFVPNALFKSGIATNVALWQMRRARWLREMRWPQLKDRSMLEIFNERFGFQGNGK